MKDKGNMMQDNSSQKQDKSVKILIGFVSFAVVGLVALLYLAKGWKQETDLDLTIFPKFHATINSFVSLLLLAGLYFIKQKKMIAHKRCMLGAMVLSALFLISYVTYHSMASTTTYGGEGMMRYFYYFILITHIILAAVVLPFILMTVFRGLKGDFARHKKIARWTWPVWFYVSVTGVLVYFMISPYY